MTKLSTSLRILIAVVFALAIASAVQAQATRTWVSGVGNDANPCSRTAPCKTFAGAISKTFINGEIDALDPGGYGTVTITKSITIDGGTGSGWASILASGASAGVIINLTDASGNDPLHTVRLRNLSINGTGSSGAVGTRTGTNGIRVLLAAGAVFVENVLITDFSNRGITDERTTGGKLYVSDSTVRNCAQSGIVILPASGSTRITGTLDNVRLEGNGGSGLVADNGSRVSISNSIVTGNLNGVVAEATQGTAELNVQNCIINNNTTGVLNATGGVVTRLSDNSIQNNATGVSASVGTAVSYGTNRIHGNTTADVTGVLTAAGAASSELGTK